MGLRFLGAMSISTLLPLLTQAQATIEALAGPGLADLEAKLAGAIALAAKVSIRPPSIAASAAVAAKIVAALSVAIAPPGVDFAAVACAQLIARLRAQIGAFRAAMQFALGLPLGAVVDVWLYEGPEDEFGRAITHAFRGTDVVYAPILVARHSDVGAIAAMQTVFMLGDSQ